MGFDRVSIYCPGLLLVKRVEQRTHEPLLQAVARTLDFGRWLSIEVPILSKAVVDNCFRPLAGKSVEILGNGDLNKMGNESCDIMCEC